MAFANGHADSVHAAFTLWRDAVLGTVRTLHTRPVNTAPATEVRAAIARELAEDSNLSYAERCRAAVAALQNLQMPDHLRHHVLNDRPMRRQNSNAFRSPNFHIVG